jgi:hypothetical protein
MTFRELLSGYSLDELWHYLSMLHELQHKPIKACILCELYGSARSEMLAIEPRQGKPLSELSCDFCSDKTVEWGVYDTGFSVTLKENEETYDIDFLPWENIIDLPVSQSSLDRYGGLLCAAEILWEATFYGYSAQSLASEIADLEEMVEEIENSIRFDLDEDKDEDEDEDKDEDKDKDKLDPHDVKATLDWFANAPDYVKRSVRHCISDDAAKFEKIVGGKLKTESIIWLPRTMASSLDINDALLLLKAFDGNLIN